MADFAETSALLAVLKGDKAEAERLLAEMLPGELQALVRACNTLGLAASIASQRSTALAARDEDGGTRLHPARDDDYGQAVEEQ